MPQDDLIERLLNPMWAHGNVPFESPQLEQEENIAAMTKAAQEVASLRSRVLVHEQLHARMIAALGLTSWHGDLADAAALLRKRADALMDGSLELVGWQYRMDDGGWCFADAPDAAELAERGNVDRFRPVFAKQLNTSHRPDGSDRNRRAECDRYMKDGGVRRAFVTIIEPGKVPDGKGPFLTVQHLDRFVTEALQHHPAPSTHVVIHQLTWDDQLWTGCARERAEIDAAMEGIDFEQLNEDDIQ